MNITGRKQYIRISRRGGAPIHAVYGISKSGVVTTECGLDRQEKFVSASVIRSTRLCWNCKRVLGWK